MIDNIVASLIFVALAALAYIGFAFSLAIIVGCFIKQGGSGE